MNPLTSEAIKRLIVAHASLHGPEILSQFKCKTAEDEQYILSCTRKLGNWKRISKRTIDQGQIERVFDCKYLYDQLRAYVVTDYWDEQVLSIQIVGE